MKNALVAKILNEIADILEVLEVQFKPRAYRKAALSIQSLSEDLADIMKDGKLEDIPGIGESIAEKIEEIVKTGKLKYLDKLRKKVPVDVPGLMSVEGIGPKKIKMLYKKFKIKTKEDLEKAAKAGKLHKIKGLGEKSEKEFVEAVKFAKSKGKRMFIDAAYNNAKQIVDQLSKRSEVSKAVIAGSLRRMKETIGDIDILVVSSKPQATMDFFASLPNVKKSIAKGTTKTSVKLDDGCQVDLRVVKPESFGSALQYFTGSKSHGIETRKVAMAKGMKLSEYGLFKGGKQIAGKTEEEVYKKMGMQYVPPELREGFGEIEAAQSGKIPKLIELSDIKGDLHMHTTNSDASNSIQEMVAEAKKLKYKYVAITDHFSNLGVVNSLTDKRMKKYINDIDKADRAVSGMKVFTGAEVDIDKEGNLIASKDVLSQLDVVIGAIHGGLKQSKAAAMKRFETAMHNDKLNIIAHPTGRWMGQRPGYDIDIDKLSDMAKAAGVVLEINSYPQRLDLEAHNVKRAVEKGCKIAINTDAHITSSLVNMRFGVGTARKGWAQAKDVINTLPLGKVKKYLN